jgi:hypothetical protein
MAPGWNNSNKDLRVRILISVYFFLVYMGTYLLLIHRSGEMVEFSPNVVPVSEAEKPAKCRSRSDGFS